MRWRLMRGHVFVVPDPTAPFNETGLQGQERKGLEFGNQVRGP